eukprot:Partr_v1_DN24294_c0_g1_i2_m36791 putative cytochrome b5 reductase
MEESKSLLIATAGIAFAVTCLFFYLARRPASAGQKQALLDKVEFRKFPLVEKTVISHNTAVYRFGLPQPSDSLNLPIGQHVSCRATVEGKEVMRSYTPTSLHTDRGFFDLLIKTYPNGALSAHFSRLVVGDTVDIRGPKGNFNYTANMCRALGMIAGGTGITPMLQIIRAILSNPADKTEVSLVFANVNEEDILLRDEIDELARKYSQFSRYYVLNNVPADWKGGVGYVTQKIITEHCPPPAADIKILLCGPPPMIKAMVEHCQVLGYEPSRTISKLEDQVFKF